MTVSDKTYFRIPDLVPPATPNFPREIDTTHVKTWSLAPKPTYQGAQKLVQAMSPASSTRSPTNNTSAAWPGMPEQDWAKEEATPSGLHILQARPTFIAPVTVHLLNHKAQSP